MTIELDNVAYRPKTLAGYACNSRLKEQIALIINAHRHTGIIPGHTLMTGGPGRGKTTLAMLLANELNLPMLTLIGSDLGNRKQLDVLFEIPQTGGILFLDEIHAIKREILEVLYAVMEDGVLGLSSKPELKFKLPPVLVIGATTDEWKLPRPLLDRFRNKLQIPEIEESEMGIVILNNISAISTRWGIQCCIDDHGLRMLIKAAAGVPRAGAGLAFALCNFAAANPQRKLDNNALAEFLYIQGIDYISGLNSVEVRVLDYLGHKDGMGLTNIASVLGINPGYLETEVEPKLLKLDLIARESRGRTVTITGRKLLRMFSIRHGRKPGLDYLLPKC